MEENDFTLYQLKEEYQALKESLSKQEIINDRLMRETMKSKVRSIRSYASISIACGIFTMIIAPVVFHYNPVVSASWCFVIFTELLMGSCIFLDWKFNHKVQKSDLSCCNMLTFNKEVKKLKENYSGWIKWGFPLILIWGGWLCSEIYFNSDEPGNVIPLLAGLILGLATGSILGYRITRKVIKTCDELISQIENQDE